MRPFDRDAVARALLYVVPTAFFCWSILHKGTPAVRHDWLWPLDKAGLLQRFLDLSSGWFSEGFGHPNAYPMTYPVLWSLIPVTLVFGTHVALASLVLLLGFVAVSAAEHIAQRFRLGRVATAALALFLLFEPWTYNKVVAGHLTQTLSYFGLVLVFAEISYDRPRFAKLALALMVTGLQLQLFLVAVAIALARLRIRSVRRALLAALVVFSPTLIGIALDRSWLLSLPFTIPWEDQQSVPLQGGSVLGGYFLHYADRAFEGAGVAGVIAFATLAALSPLAVRSLRQAVLASIGVATLVFVGGTSWWLAGFWHWAILNAPVIGVFREMYDLIAVVAVVYALLAAAMLQRFAWLKWPALASALAIASAWVHQSPVDYWVAGEALQPAGAELERIHASRYAIMPPFQPQAYEGNGGGADPLYAGRAPDQYPVNALLPLFPEDRALQDFWSTGDSGRLERLGVVVIECRRGFEEAPKSFFHIESRQVAGKSVCKGSEIVLPHPAPIAALEATFGSCSLCSNSGSGNIFLGDIKPQTFQTLANQREFVDPANGWVDVRLMFASEPKLAQGIGGSYTTQAAGELRVPAGPYALVNVIGALFDRRGRIVARDTDGYRWAALPNQTHALICRGACVVVGVGNPGTVPLENTPAPAQPLRMKFLTAWLCFVDIPAESAGLLRVLTSYDPGWAAFPAGRGGSFQHLRVDATFNGWIVPRASEPRRIWLAHVPSLLQAFAGVCGAVCVLIVLGIAARDVVAGMQSSHMA